MCFSSMQIACTGFSDHENDATHYTIEIEQDSTTTVTLVKRYSDFKALYDSLLPRFAELKACKFPKKSVFNTQAQFTKDRRLKGFDLFLKTLVTIDPLPTEARDFLQLPLIFNDKQSYKSIPSTSRSNTPPAASSPLKPGRQPSSPAPSPPLITVPAPHPPHPEHSTPPPLPPPSHEYIVYTKLRNNFVCTLLSCFVFVGTVTVAILAKSPEWSTPPTKRRQRAAHSTNLNSTDIKKIGLAMCAATIALAILVTLAQKSSLDRKKTIPESKVWTCVD